MLPEHILRPWQRTR